MSESQQAQADGAQESAAPPTTRPPTRAQEMLLDFLQEHDAACPVCGYNVRALTRPICPECKQELTITVGVTRLRLGWLFASLAPGFFSGIAACFVLIPIGGTLLFGNQSPPILIIALDLFGWCSGIFAIILAYKRHRFLALPLAQQRWFALMMWGIHITAFVLFVLFAALFL